MKLFGYVREQPVYQYTLRNKNIEATVITYGATLTGVRVPDAKGQMRDVVLKHPNLEGYINLPGRLGATIGRVANRIADGRFTIGEQTYQVACNNGGHCLHGGKMGFDRQIWQAAMEGENCLTLSYLSANGEEGFPGNLQVSVTYSLTQDQGLCISYRAKSDADTLVNLTNHTYFNLHGESRSAEGMQLWIDADRITPVNEQMVPDNTFREVEGTIYDFRSPRGFSGDLSREPVLAQRGYYDENYVLSGTGLRTVARLSSGETGITMEVMTDQPGMQLFTGNPNGVALETQHFPNAANCPDYPSVVLLKNQIYETRTIYRFLANT